MDTDHLQHTGKEKTPTSLILVFALGALIGLYSLATFGGKTWWNNKSSLEKAAFSHRWGNKENTIKFAQECVQQHIIQAERIQAELERSNEPIPPRSLNMDMVVGSYNYPYPFGQQRPMAKIRDEARALVEEILSRGPLNEAAFCLWMIAEAEARSADLVKARVAYLKVQRLSYGLVMDGRTGRGGTYLGKGTEEDIKTSFLTSNLWFWSPFHEASVHLTKDSSEPPVSLYSNIFGLLESELHQPETYFPHLIVSISRPAYGQSVDKNVVMEGRVGMIPDHVYQELQIPTDRLIDEEEYQDIHQNQVFRLYDRNIIVDIPSDLSLYVLATGDTSQTQPFMVRKAEILGTRWRAEIDFDPFTWVGRSHMEMLVAASYGELPSELVDLPDDIWPTAWTRVVLK